MSEFSIEEKANAYDIALKKAKTLLSKCKRVSDKASMIYRAEDIENMFPEFQKPEEERIKEALIELVKCNERSGYTLLNNVSTSSMINWLKKQNKETVYQPKNNDKNLKNVLIRFFEDRYPKAMEIYDGDFTVTVGQILAWLAKQNDQNSNILWHDVSEEPEEHREIFCKWKGSDDNTWHDVVFYHANDKTFWDGEQQIEDVIKWTYVDEILNKSNPYSGVSFQYNGHTWGMCARDGGVEISIDNELKAFVSIDKSFIYPISQSYLAPKSASQAIKEIIVDNANKVEND